SPPARSLVDVFEETSLQRARLLVELERRQALHDPRQTQMVVVAGPKPHGRTGRKVGRIDLDEHRAVGWTAAPKPVEPQHALERLAEPGAQLWTPRKRVHRPRGDQRRRRID